MSGTIDPAAAARDFPRRASPIREMIARQEDPGFTTALDYATQPEADTRIEYLTELPDPTSGDVGRQIVVQAPGTNQTITYVGTLTTSGIVVWMETAGITDFVAYSWVQNYSTGLTGCGPVGLGFFTNGDTRVLCFTSDAHRWIGFDFSTSGGFATTPNSCTLTAGGSQSQEPYGQTLVDDITIFVTYRGCHRVVRWDGNSIASADFAIGSGVAGSGANDFNQPRHLTHDGEFLYVVDGGNNRIVVMGLTPPYTRVLTFGTAGAGNGQFATPTGIAVDQSGSIYVSDSLNHRIQKFTSTGSFLWAVGSSAGSAEGQFDTPLGMALDPRGRLHVVDANNSRVQVFDQNGTFLTAYGSAGSGDGQLATPYAIAIQATGLVAVSDNAGNKISYWQEGPSTDPGGPSFIPQTLNDLTDVSTTSPAQGSFLRRSGSLWIDQVITVNRRVNRVTNIDNGSSAASQICCGNDEQVLGCACWNVSGDNGLIVYGSSMEANCCTCGWRNQWGANNRSAEAQATCLKLR